MPHFPITGAAPALGELTRDARQGIGFGFGLQRLERDVFLVAALGTTLEFGPVGVGVQVPLRFRVYNLDTKGATFQLRRQDWDEVSDYFKILRYVQYGQPRDAVFARFGELAGTTLGHGTIVDDYYNAIDVDHYQAGLRFNLNLDAGGAETMLNSVSAPRLAGGRIYVRPWHFIDACSFLCRLAIGASVFVDGAAPTTLAGATVDGQNNFVGTRTRALAVYGLDAELNLISTPLLDLTPYADLNFIGGHGSGLHTGALFAIHPPGLAALARLEYRRMGAEYLPRYFNALYEVQRFSFRDGRTKLQFLDEGGNGGAVNGYYAELLLTLANQISISGGFEDYQGPNNAALLLRLALPEVLGVRLGGTYLKRNFDGFEALFEPNDSLGILEARFAVNDYFSVIGQRSRQWKLRSDGEFEVLDTWAVGTSFNFSF